MTLLVFISSIPICLFPILLCMHSPPKWSAPYSPALETVRDIMHRLSLLLAPPRRDFVGLALVLAPILSASYPHRALPATHNSPIAAHPRSQPFHARFGPCSRSLFFATCYTVLIDGTAGTVRRPLTLSLR